MAAEAIRAFFCVPLPDRAKQDVGTVAQRIRSELRARASWVAQANYHVTLRFLGDIDPAATVALREAALEMARTLKPFELTLDRAGAFPSVDRARVVWMGGETPEAFRTLVDGLNARIEALGYVRERRTPLAHVTLARIKDRPVPMAFPSMVPTVLVPVNRIVLMESRLTSQGAIYTPLFRVSID